MEMDEWIIALGRKCQYLKSLKIGAVVLHFDRDQTTAAVPFRSVDEGEREREGMKRKQEQLRIQINIKLVKIGQVYGGTLDYKGTCNSFCFRLRIATQYCSPQLPHPPNFDRASFTGPFPMNTVSHAM